MDPRSASVSFYQQIWHYVNWEVFGINTVEHREKWQ